MNEILTAHGVAKMLRNSKRQVYELAKGTENPIPSIRIRTGAEPHPTERLRWATSLTLSSSLLIRL
jgi:hypothetical protein